MKPAALLRSLFVAASLASLVACTFEDPTSEEEKGSSSALRGHRDADASADDDDADASAPRKGHSSADGGTKLGADAGWNGNADGGAWGDDDDADGGAWGDDDDDSWGADAGAAWGTDGGR